MKNRKEITMKDGMKAISEAFRTIGNLIANGFEPDRRRATIGGRGTDDGFMTGPGSVRALPMDSTERI